jgi:hypothetical protein
MVKSFKWVVNSVGRTVILAIADSAKPHQVQGNRLLSMVILSAASANQVPSQSDRTTYKKSHCKGGICCR